MQLRALGVLQLQRAVTPKFVSARAAALQRASSTNGNDSRNSKETVTRAIASASRSMRSRRLGPPPARVIRSPQSLHTAKITTLYIPIFRGVPEDQHPTCGQHLGGYQCKRQHCSQSCWEMAILTPKMSLLCSILTCVNTTDNLEPFSSSFEALPMSSCMIRGHSGDNVSTSANIWGRFCQSTSQHIANI